MSKKNSEKLNELSRKLSGMQLSGKSVVSVEIEDLIGPTIVLTVELSVDSNPLKKAYYIYHKDEDQFRMEMAHNSQRLGTDVEEAFIAASKLIEEHTPVVIRRKLSDYNGWKMYLTSRDGGLGGMATNGSQWMSTDVSFGYKDPRDKNTEEQLKLMVDSFK